MISFNLDNDGEGFEIADNDLEAMLQKASAGEENDEQEDYQHSLIFGQSPTETTPATVATPTPEPEPEVVFSEHKPVLSEPIVHQPALLTDEIRIQEETPEVVETPPVKIAPTPPAPVAEVITKPTISGDQQDFINRVIHVIDEYRKLSPEIQQTVSQFISNGQIITEENILVESVLNCSPLLVETMTAMKEAYRKDTVGRAFYVMELSDEVLHNLGDLIAIFTKDPIDADLTHNKYAYNVVVQIEKLDDEAMKYITATESVLSAGRKS